MGGVAADEHALIAKAVRDEAAPHPVLFREDLVFEAMVNAEDGPDSPIAIDRFIPRLVVIEEIVNEPIGATIDGEHVAAAAGIQRLVEPSRLSGQ